MKAKHVFVPTLSESLKYVLFYVVCAGIFCAGIYASKGGEAASATTTAWKKTIERHVRVYRLTNVILW